MTTPLVLAISVAVGMALFTFVAGRSLVAATVRYRETFQETARINLAEMFLFVEPSRLFMLNLMLIGLVLGAVLVMGGGPVLAVMAAAATGASPPLVWRLLHSRRRNRIVAQLPDALMATAANLRSGLSLNQALETTSAYESPPLKHELDLILRELALGVDFGEALDKLHRRVPVVDVQLLTAAMRVSREIGGNLAESLERISDTLRKRLQMEGKIRSLTAQGKAQGLVMVLLPVFLIVVLRQLEPAAMEYLFHSWYGWVTLAVIVVLEAIGYHFIRKIISIDV